MLLAHQGGDDPRLARSVQYLVRQALENDDLEHLGWIRLALEVYRSHDGVAAALARLDERIRAAHAARLVNPYVRPAPLRDATLPANGREGEPAALLAGGSTQSGGQTPTGGSGGGAAGQARFLRFIPVCHADRRPVARLTRGVGRSTVAV